jgi:hypothetical protein
MPLRHSVTVTVRQLRSPSQGDNNRFHRVPLRFHHRPNEESPDWFDPARATSIARSLSGNRLRERRLKRRAAPAPA